MDEAHATDPDRVLWERDLYRQLLDLGAQDDLEAFLEDALRLILELTNSDQGYLELNDAATDESGAWSLARRMSEDEVDAVRTRISRGIIAEALATGETIATHSALLDERFSEQKSVQAAGIGAVVCAPVGGRSGLGAVYLGRDRRGGQYTDADREAAEIFARHLAPLADGLVRAARESRTTDATRELRDRNDLRGILGRSDALARALEPAMLAAPLEVTVLLTGESGTGKTQLARAIHDNSARCRGPFVELNCAALPDALIESELFGARAGAHSAASNDVSGKVEAAEGGTLFLDEVGELPVAAQAKLLQLLQSHEYFPLGATTPQQADIRVLAATNADLEARVGEKLFREDLYYRLHVLPIRLPGLRERREDVVELAQALCARVVEQNRLGDLSLSPSALRAIHGADWPGNVRELESTIAASAIRAAGDRATEIGERHVFPAVADTPPIDAASERLSFQEATRFFQRDLLARTLEETDWNVTETSRRLDLARSRVYALIDGFGFKRDAD